MVDAAGFFRMESKQIGQEMAMTGSPTAPCDRFNTSPGPSLDRLTAGGPSRYSLTTGAASCGASGGGGSMTVSSSVIESKIGAELAIRRIRFR